MPERERPIIMSERSIDQLLGDLKTVSRRPVTIRGQRPDWDVRLLPDAQGRPTGYFVDPATGEAWVRQSPYGGIGTVLWVRERYAVRAEGGRLKYVYWADRRQEPPPGFGPWRSPIYLPRAAARLTLRVTNVALASLWRMHEGDARAEGYGSLAEFREEWDWLNARRGFGWATNPWCWVVTFQREPTLGGPQ